jgi:hypothetical protein
MASTYSALKIELIGTGEQAGTWGTTTNINLGNGGAGLEQAIVGMATLETADFTANSYTLPYTDTNGLQDFRALVLDITATLSGAGEVIVPAIQKPYIILNNSVGGYAVTVKVTGQTGVSVPNGAKILVYNNGTDVGAAITHLTSLTLASALPVASGGTGVTTSTGTGSVVLSNTPTLVTPLLGTPTSGTLTNCTGLPISTGVSGLGANVATFLATPSSANLASAVSDETGSGSLVFNTAPSFATSITLNAQAPVRFADSDSSNYVAFQAPATVASNVTWTLPSADGTSNQVLTTNGSGTLSWSTPAGGATIGQALAFSIIFGL